MVVRGGFGKLVQDQGGDGERGAFVAQLREPAQEPLFFALVLALELDDDSMEPARSDEQLADLAAWRGVDEERQVRPPALDGRSTDQGRLVIRYGLPRYWFQARADKRLELTPTEQRMAGELMNCATSPLPGNRGGVCAMASVQTSGVGVDAGGRWTFWFYGPDAPPLIFERALGYRLARHKFETRSRELDSLLARALPSSYEPPHEVGTIRALVTRFPRPERPVVEVHAEFGWPEIAVSERASVGVFLHDRTTGRLRTTYRGTSRENPARFHSILAGTGALRLGARVDADRTLVWEVERPIGQHALYLPDVVTIELPEEEEGDVLVRVTVSDRAGRAAVAVRQIAVRR